MGADQKGDWRNCFDPSNAILRGAGGSTPLTAGGLFEPFAYIEFSSSHRGPWVLDENRLIEKLAGGPKKLDSKTVEASVAVLKKITQRAAKA
jgi:hypothetical protein